MANAVVIDFTGGTAYLTSGGTSTTNDVSLYTNLDCYEKGGFRLSFLANSGAQVGEIVGNYYYNPNLYNDVIPAHWTSGFGNVDTVRIEKIGGGPASGNEQAYIRNDSGYAGLLPSDDWGWAGPNPQIFLGSQFDAVNWLEFYVTNQVDCFGMDNFYIDEPGPYRSRNQPPCCCSVPDWLVLPVQQEGAKKRCKINKSFSLHSSGRITSLMILPFFCSIFSISDIPYSIYTKIFHLYYLLFDLQFGYVCLYEIRITIFSQLISIVMQKKSLYSTV